MHVKTSRYTPSKKEKKCVGCHETQTRGALTSIVWIVLIFPNPFRIITAPNILNTKLISSAHSSLHVLNSTTDLSVMSMRGGE